MHATRCLVIVVLAVGAVACGRPPRWNVDPKPSPESVVILLEGDPLDAQARDLLPSELSEIPIRQRLRPCCAFGTGLRVRVGAVPIPGFRIGNIIDLSGVEFLTSSCVSDIAQVLVRAGQLGRSVSINASKRVARLLALGGIDDLGKVEVVE